MHEKYDSTHNAYLVRDAHNVVREISHRPKPFSTEAQTPQILAQSYLRSHTSLLGTNTDELANLGLSPEREPVDAKVQYRFLQEKTFFDLTTVGYYQTYFGLPVWEAGMAVQVKHNPYRVVSWSSTAHRDIEIEKPKVQSIRRFREVSAKELQAVLKLPAREGEEHYDLKSLRVNRSRFIIFRFDSTRRLPESGEVDEVKDRVFSHAHPSLPVPPVAQEIQESRHYVAVEILFTLATARWGTLNWVVIVEVETASALYLRALVDNVDGQIFASDPASQGSAAAPSANNATLNPFRTSVTLQGLSAPSGGNQALAGTYVQVSDHEPPAVAVPAEPVGTNFNYDTRTNNFAAVNCYHHCDSFFRLIADMGFAINSYFDGTTFPVSIDHRGRFGTTDGIEINASCGGNATSNGIGLPDFELADLSDTTNPVGIAADRRVVLHELGGHGILWDWVNSANFGFAHSAGDSFAAILCDPDSTAADRFLTFPWITTSRRHDRPVGSGWAWGGVNDTGGYNAEQILSTTNFRIYSSLGGDAASVSTRQFGARYTAYLMLRAVSTLTPATNPGNATGFASALMTADLADWTSEGHSGGAYGKVIRWAFEKQGLYQPPGAATPVVSPGAPPDVDVYIDDGRQGEYQYQPNHWSCQKIWNRRMADGGTTHEEPIVGVSNYAYVKIKNRGTQMATNVVVKGFHCQPGSGLVWPNDWQAMTTAQLSAPNVPPNSSAEITVGPFEWVPTQPDHECMLMIVSATGDPSNIDNFTAGDSIPEWRLVPHDNNIGQRNVSPVPAGGGFQGLLTAFSPRRFVVRNPHRGTARVEIIPTLPKLLSERGWECLFDNPGGRAFSLAPGQSREIVLRLKPGGDFSRFDVESTVDRTIHLLTLADGIVIGGMSYELDPNLKTAPSRFPTKCKTGDTCAEKANQLLDCLELPVNKVKSVRVRKITVDIEIEDGRDCK